MRRTLALTLLALLAIVALAVPASAAHEPPAPAPGEPGHFTTILSDSEGTRWWTADYLRSLPSGYGWTDGDRSGYRCFYAFIVDARGRVVGRVTFTRIDGADYATILDKYMAEGVRYYNGTLAPPGAPKELGQCPAPSASYEPYFGPDERPVITYNVRGQAIETRDYTEVVAAPGITFRHVEDTPTRQAVIAHRDGLPVIAVYYDSLSPRLTMAGELGNVGAIAVD